MPSTYSQNYYHTVFSTKHRADLIVPELEERLYPFMGGIVRDLRCQLIAVNGMPDHVAIAPIYLIRSCCSRSKAVRQNGSTKHSHTLGTSRGKRVMVGLRSVDPHLPRSRRISDGRRSIIRSKISNPSFSNFCGYMESSSILMRCFARAVRPPGEFDTGVPDSRG
jgi:hypothetical protein